MTGVLTRSLGKGQLSEVLMNSMRIVGGCNANVSEILFSNYPGN